MPTWLHFALMCGIIQCVMQKAACFIYDINGKRKEVSLVSFE